MDVPVNSLKNSSLLVRLVLFVFLPVFVFAGALGYLIFSRLEQWSEERMQEDVQLVARTLEGPVGRAMERQRQGTLEHSLESVIQIGRVYGAYLYDDQGVMIAASDTSPRAVTEADIFDVLAEEEQTGGYGEMAGESIYSYFVPLEGSGGGFLGLLQISRLHREMLDQINRLRAIGLASLLLGGGGMMGIVFVGYRNAIGRSLIDLRDTMGKVKTGQRRHRATVQGPLEMASLASSFNRMLDSMEAAEEEIERRRTSEAKLEKRLQKTENLAALGQVAAGVAHELGTPLSVVDGKAQRALRTENLPESCRMNLEAVRAEVRRMEQIVRQLLEFGRSHDAQKRRVRLDHLLQRAVRSHEGTGKENPAVSCRAGEGAPVVEVNPVRAEIALINLLKNAVRTEGVRNVFATWRRSGGWAEVVVEDDGPGVPPDLRAKIFQPFFTTRAGQQGSGLGLAIVQQVADENGGAVLVETSDLGGAAFRLRLPLAEEDA